MADAAMQRAGRRIAQRAQRASDDLLALEERCYVAIRRAFAGETRRVAMLFANLDEQRLRTGQWQPMLERVARPVLAACRASVEDLMGACFDLTLASIGDELGHLALPGGSVDRALVNVALLRADAIDTPDLTTGTLDVLRARVGDALRLSWSRGETRDQLVQRVVAERPALIGGRVGAWPGTVSWMTGEVRRQVIDLANSVRIATIDEVNGA